MAGHSHAPLLASLESKPEIESNHPIRGDHRKNAMLAKATEERQLEPRTEERIQSPGTRTQPPRVSQQESNCRGSKP